MRRLTSYVPAPMKAFQPDAVGDRTLPGEHPGCAPIRKLGRAPGYGRVG